MITANEAKVGSEGALHFKCCDVCDICKQPFDDIRSTINFDLGAASIHFSAHPEECWEKLLETEPWDWWFATVRESQ